MTWLSTGAGAILAITVLTSLIGLFIAPTLIQRSLFRPYNIARGKDYATVITSGIVHADLAHLLFNMLTFWFFAFPLERRIGTPMFLALYLVGLVLSEARTFFKHRNSPQYASLGASGAISAVLFAAIVYFPGMSLYVGFLPLPIPAPLYGVGYLIYSWYAGRRAGDRINHDAHLDGALAGLLFVALTNPSAFEGLLRLYS
jgi:membrane associated rhomboid family serine protease